MQAYHLLCGLQGESLSEGKARLNTCTLALYDRHKEGEYIDLFPEMYCDARHYNFFYGEGDWGGAHSGSFLEEMNKLEVALDTPWADLMRGTLPSEQVEIALRKLRERK